MKTYLLSLLLIASCLPNLLGQDLSKSNNVLLELKSGSSTGVLNSMDKYEPVTDREKKLFSRNTDSLRVMMQRYAYQIYYQALQEQAGIKLADKDALRDRVSYTKAGFPTMVLPKSVIKRIVKKGHQADYYFSLSVSVELHSGFSLLSSGVTTAISCDIKIYSPDAKIIKKVNVRYKAPYEIKSTDFPEYSFDKLAFDHIMILAKKLKPAVKGAVKEVVSQL